MVSFFDQTKDHMCDELETGDAAADWAYALDSPDTHVAELARRLLERR